ncbi:hypothetical protein QE429_002867 [Bacillus sp. SORGH_AS 510]|uniref:hypothetical protein n=1 Tax=Bacillus sp. SORGH_AS_0510 TaxID=3041771 RepID=UPI002784A7F3|nr:hypothetical protein [Bacillus sp. SORGH_AS_0510]MDQ1146040.1 hypothetical protein [Bacillus sp. SORGH_AS_0510]
MASFLRPVACPDCGRFAVEDYYYRIGAGYIICQCCGCEVDREAKYDPENNTSYFEIEKRRGYGKFFLKMKDGTFSSKLLMSPLTNEQFENLKGKFYNDDVDREKSYLVTYKNGEFETLFGSVPEDFHLSFAEYIEKYGYDCI